MVFRRVELPDRTSPVSQNFTHTLPADKPYSKTGLPGIWCGICGISTAGSGSGFACSILKTNGPKLKIDNKFLIQHICKSHS